VKISIARRLKDDEDFRDFVVCDDAGGFLASKEAEYRDFHGR
jgi:hypothetical protein